MSNYFDHLLPWFLMANRLVELEAVIIRSVRLFRLIDSQKKIFCCYVFLKVLVIEIFNICVLL